MYTKKISKLALLSMLKELDIKEKPGLVSPISNGNHLDMDYFLMRRGIKSLKNYFESAFRLGYFKKSFKNMRELGKKYEREMFLKTNGINTHKGAIFQLGILVYIVGRIKSRGIFISKENFKDELEFEIDILGLKKLLKESVYGARREVSDGFKLSFLSLNYSLDKRLYFIMSKIHDTNIIRRGGSSLLEEIKRISKLAIFNSNYKAKVKNIIDEQFLSPGGAADILINSIFIEDFFKFENDYLKNLQIEILNTKELVANFNYNYKLILSLVVPGFIKTDENFLKYFNRYKRIFDKIHGEGKKIYNLTGYRVIYDINKNVDENALKAYSMALEEGSLIDIDIYTNRVIDRKYMQSPQRKCLLCDDAAKICMINRNHKTDEIIKRALEIIDED